MRKRLLSLTLALVMCLALTAPAFAADFVIQNGVLTEYKGAGGAVTVPDGVTKIGDYAFHRNKTITSVALPNSVTSIGSGAFKDCWNIKSINIPSGVTYIGSFAFELCMGLTGDIVIPSGVTSIGDFAFNSCSGVTSVTLPDGLKSIGKNAFSFTTFTSIDIPDSVDFIGEHAFAFSEITHITVPASMTVIGEGAFASCYDLSSITIHNRVTRIEEDAFASCIHLTSIDIPESVTYIAPHAFGATALTSFTFPSGITEISENMFNASTNLASVTIPAGVTAIRNGAFWDCSGLKDIYFGGSESQWAAITIENEDPFGTHPTAIPRRTVIHYNETAGPSSNPITPSNPAVTPADPVTPTGPIAPSNQVTPAVPVTSTTGFSDVAADAYYAAPVTWAVEKGITKGTDEAAKKFSPGQNCTNAQILTFLWRAYGQPEPSIANPFTNSIPDAYIKAAIWAYEKGMVSGTTFDAGKPCTRAMAVTYLWQAAGSPTAPAASFTDVPSGASYAPAVAWAVEQKITTGTDEAKGTFSPDDICNRGQIVTFLHRNLA